MDDDTGPIRLSRVAITAVIAAVVAGSVLLAASPWAQSGAEGGRTSESAWSIIAGNFTAGVTLSLILLAALSAFFSASEVAFFSLHRVRLRAMASEKAMTGRLIASLMRHPGQLLNTILIGNMIVNTLISVLLPTRLDIVITRITGWGPIASSVLTVGLSTFALVFFGEIAPKVFAVSIAEPFARAAVLPMRVADMLFKPARWASLRFTELLFRVTRFNDIQPAPFMTDEEIISILSDSEAQGVIEEQEGQMIQAILESGDAYVREILVPRPDVVAIERGAAVREAIDLFRRHSFSRMPVYQEDLDHITGVLVAKDLLPCVMRGELDRPIGPLARRASFVPETMSIREFIRYSQRRHMHLSVVVDEYGGTEGLVTLDDAIEEVVGEIRDAGKTNNKRYKRLAKGSYRVEGSLPLSELSRILGIEIESPEHETVAGFFMEQLKRIPEEGDKIESGGVLMTVEETEGKRASQLRVEVKRVRQEQSA